MMAYRTTKKADADIIDIYLYGARVFGAVQAERYHAGLVRVFEEIAAQPLLMRERMEFRPPVRLYPHQTHVIAYLAEDSGDVLIVRVLHGRQDWERHLSA